MIRDITTKRNKTVPPLLPPGAAITNHTTFATDMMDTQGARGAEVSVISGAQVGNDGSNYVTPVLQESDTVHAADFANVAAADIVGGVAPGAVGANTVQKIGYIGMKRYIRINFVFTGTGVSSAYLAAIGALEFASLMPGTDPSPMITN